MKDYLLLMRGGDARMENMTEEQRNKHMADWGIFMNNLAQAGHLTGGLPLGMDAKLLTKDGATDELVRSEKGEVIGGYLLIKANDYDHAIELTKPCPLFEHDGNIEIREAIPMD
jgi:hypothetical protein